jgi:hypothetical protein
MNRVRALLFVAIATKQRSENRLLSTEYQSEIERRNLLTKPSE